MFAFCKALLVYLSTVGMVIALQAAKRKGKSDSGHSSKRTKFAHTASSDWRESSAGGNDVEMSDASDSSESFDDELEFDASSSSDEDESEVVTYHEATNMCTTRYGKYYWNYWIGDGKVTTSYLYCIAPQPDSDMPYRYAVSFGHDDHTATYQISGSEVKIKDPLADLPIPNDGDCQHAADAVRDFLVSRDNLDPNTPIWTILCSMYRKDVYEKAYPPQTTVTDRFGSLSA